MIDHRETLTLIIVGIMLLAAVVVMGIAAALGKALTKREKKGVGCWWVLIIGLIVLVVVAMASPNNAIWVPLPGSLTPP